MVVEGRETSRDSYCLGKWKKVFQRGSQVKNKRDKEKLWGKMLEK